jgi:cysteine desulfuration protein SufE
MTLSDKQHTLIQDLNLIEDPHERLSAVVARGARSPLPDPLKADANLVSGCVSRVWLTGALRNGRCHFDCDADSPMVRGLVAMLCDLYSGAPPAEVVTTEPEFWEQCGFVRLLSPTRLNGLRSVRARIRELALAMKSDSVPAE